MNRRRLILGAAAWPVGSKALSAPLADVLGSPVAGKLQLEARNYDVGAVSLIVDQSNLWIKGVRGATVISSRLIDQLIYLGSVANVVFEDIHFRSDLSNAVEGDGLIKAYHERISNVRFVRCSFSVPRANTNAIKIVCDRPGSSCDRLHFEDCQILGAGRMGLEVQNHVTDKTARYHDVVWAGGMIARTGLRNPYGMGVSLTGYGQNCDIGQGTLFKDNLYASIENVGASSSRFSGKIQGNGGRGRCDVISFTNARRMQDNVIEGLETAGEVDGGYVLRNQLRWRERNIRLRLTGMAAYHDVDEGISDGMQVLTRAPVALFVEQDSTGNVWRRGSFDNSAAGGKGYSVIRFSGRGTHGNLVDGPILSRATAGGVVDQILNASRNRVVGVKVR